MANSEISSVLADCVEHVGAWVRHKRAVYFWQYRNNPDSMARTWAREDRFRRRIRVLEARIAVLEFERNEGAWRGVADFLSSEPRRGGAGALAPAGRS